jgi:hypothetical protein
MSLLTFFLSKYFDLGLLEPFEKIYVLVSGGMDSTLLATVIHERYPEKTWFVNCYNPYEQSPTLDQMKESDFFLMIKPEDKYDYHQILVDAFCKLNTAAELRSAGTYEKKIFDCCKWIKHKAFGDDDLFREEGSVIISGIKAGDGRQRALWLKSLVCGKSYTNGTKPEIGFFHRHKNGILYCYPFRDYIKREFPPEIITELRKAYPKLAHSGCAICPVVLLFGDRIKEYKRFRNAVQFTRVLIKQGTFKPSDLLLQYVPELGNTRLEDFLKSPLSSPK